MTFQETHDSLQAKLKGIIPDIEMKYKAEIAYKINCLKKEKNAVILGHNYMEPALYHLVCDFTGDSLELSREAALTQNDIIVFCGVRFMAETAKILNPRKTVLLPSEKAGCSLASGITAEDVRRLKTRFPGAPVVAYVNTYADVKAESDICCTSSNAAKIINSLDSDLIIFLPDEYLARNVAKETGKRIIFPNLGNDFAETNFQMVGWKGRCEVHEKFTVEDIRNVRSQFRDVAVLAHPECSPEVIAASDFSGSTTAMIQYVAQTNASRYLLLTECAMGDNIAAENKQKEMVRACNVRCSHMNHITLENTLAALENEQYVIDVPEEIRIKAFRAVKRMLAVD